MLVCKDEKGFAEPHATSFSLRIQSRLSAALLWRPPLSLLRMHPVNAATTVIALRGCELGEADGAGFRLRLVACVQAAFNPS
jgi:hypothetical protein